MSTPLPATLACHRQSMEACVRSALATLPSPVGHELPTGHRPPSPVLRARGGRCPYTSRPNRLPLPQPARPRCCLAPAGSVCYPPPPPFLRPAHLSLAPVLRPPRLMPAPSRCSPTGFFLPRPVTSSPSRGSGSSMANSPRWLRLTWRCWESKAICLFLIC
jgi:hypothetical protein